MNAATGTVLEKSAFRLLCALAAGPMPASGKERAADDIRALLASDLARRVSQGSLEITGAGKAYLARAAHRRSGHPIDPFQAQHADLADGIAILDETRTRVTVDESESPLAWLARRKGRDGRALIEPHQLLAGERLRSEFTRAQLMPRTTSNWQAPIASGRRTGAGGGQFTDAVVSARQRVRTALDAVGPEMSGLLLDVCCFLKGLEDVERERRWPPRSGKIVLQLALERLARHFGYDAEASGRAHAALRTWSAPREAAGAE